MEINQKIQQWLEKARERFFALDLNGLDEALTPAEQAEWDNIYASFRSGSLMRGRIVGIENMPQPEVEINSEISDEEVTNMPCMIVLPYRVKILIPEPFFWWQGEERESFVLNNMAGANVDFVIIAVDRVGGCAIASRTMALSRRRWEAKEIAHVEEGSIVDCDVLSVGPSRLTLSCYGYDETLTQIGLSYSYLGDLRDTYRPGQILHAKVLSLADEHLEVSVKAAAPNPYDGVRQRHPPGSIRMASITSKYAGGVFVRLDDGCTAVCRYARHFSDDQFQPGDTVKVEIVSYSDNKQWMLAKIKGKIG